VAPLIDPGHPFFRPRWRRWATVLVPAIWAVLELTWSEPFWAIIFGAVAVYAARVLLWTGRQG